MIVGLDMGGTHIDGVIISDRKILKTIKRPTDRDNLFDSIWSTLSELLKGYDPSKIKRINLSTTISTNAIVENKVERVGMIIQSGPGLNTDFLAIGNENSFISGYTDHRGVVVEALKTTEIQAAKKKFQEKGIQSLAVISKFSTRNPQSELQIKQELGSAFNPITLGYTMSGKLNFPRRVFTSYLNSAVFDTFSAFAISIKKSLEKEGIQAELFILKADGGTMDMQSAEKKPVETILSGPAASFMGISALSKSSGDAILLDIGGTTTDIFFLADNVPLFEPLGAKIATYPTLVRAIYSDSIGLGGDSGIQVENKQLHIGPKRNGKPYAFGGPTPTPTDAMIFLELLPDIQKEARKKAQNAMEQIAAELTLTTTEAANLILKTMGQIIKTKTDELLLEINSKPIYTVKELLHSKKLKPQSLCMIGGPAAILAPFIENHYQLPCFVPTNYAVANAIGAALARPTMEITLLANTAQGTLSVPEFAIYEQIPRNYSLDQARERINELLKQFAVSKAMNEQEFEVEITEESSFNMVRGFSTSGKNIRLKAQIKPGHLLTLRSESNESEQ